MDVFTLKLVSPLEKVLPGREPSSEGVRAVLSALRGETVSFQIAYCHQELDGFRFGKLAISSPAAHWVRVRTVELVPCEYPCSAATDEDYLAKEPGLYPDRLQELTAEMDRIPLVHKQWRSLWVDMEVPEDAQAGDYPITVSLYHENQQMGALTVTLHVIPARLPHLSIYHTEWFHSDCLANYYGVEVFSEEYWRIVENFVRTAAKHHYNMLLTPLFTPPLDTAVGGERRTVQLVGVTVTETGYQFDFANFRRWVQMAKNSGIRYFEMSHLFTQWGAKAAPKIMAWKDGLFQRIFGWETDAQGEAYATFLRSFLPELLQELDALKIRDRTLFHVSDEPNMGNIDSYRSARNLLSGLIPGYPIFDALSDYSFYAQGLVTQPVCSLDHIGAFLEKRREGQPLWGYYCCAQGREVSNRFIVHPGWRTRVLGAQVYKYQLDGFLQWGYNFYNSGQSLFPIDPYRCTDAARSFPAGDSFVVYPGADGMPEESLRLMLMDQAMSDHCAMDLLESLRGREAVLRCMEPEGEEITITRYPRGPEYLTAMRERINREIEAAILNEGCVL